MKQQFINSAPHLITQELREKIMDVVRSGICSPQDIANFALSLATDKERQEAKHG